MTDEFEALKAVPAQAEAARLAARKTKKPKKARRLRAWAAALERGVSAIKRIAADDEVDEHTAHSHLGNDT